MAHMFPLQSSLLKLPLFPATRLQLHLHGHSTLLLVSGTLPENHTVTAQCHDFMGNTLLPHAMVTKFVLPH